VPKPPLVPPEVPVLPLLHPTTRKRAVKDEIVRLVSVIPCVCREIATSVTVTSLFSFYCSKQ
jgi:hypothetical protein